MKDKEHIQNHQQSHSIHEERIQKDPPAHVTREREAEVEQLEMTLPGEPMQDVSQIPNESALLQTKKYKERLEKKKDMGKKEKPSIKSANEETDNTNHRYALRTGNSNKIYVEPSLRVKLRRGDPYPFIIKEKEEKRKRFQHDDKENAVNQ